MTDETEDRTSVDNALELQKYSVGVHDPEIKKTIGPDFVLAKSIDGLTLKDKVFAIEMTSNAYYAAKMCFLIYERYKRQFLSKQGLEEKDIDLTKPKTEIEWHLVRLRKDIDRHAREIFNNFMVKPKMMMILSRNVDMNYVMDRIAGKAAEDTAQKEEEEEKTGILKKLLKIKKKKEEDED